MSRSIEEENGVAYIKIISMDKCKDMYDGKCWNGSSENCGCDVSEYKCDTCKQYEKEDGII